MTDKHYITQDDIDNPLGGDADFSAEWTPPGVQAELDTGMRIAIATLREMADSLEAGRQILDDMDIDKNYQRGILTTELHVTVKSISKQAFSITNDLMSN